MQECGRVGKCHLYPDHSFLDISSTPERNTNIQSLQLSLSLNLSPPEEMLHQLLTAVSECGGLSQAPASTSGCFTLAVLDSQKTDSSMDFDEVSVQGKPLVRPLQGKEGKLRPAGQLPSQGSHPGDFVHMEEQEPRCLF